MSGSLLTQHRKRPELMLVPLIDVLTMLIFFSFVTMQFKSASTLNITLPKVESAGKGEFKGNVVIAIDKSGTIAVNGKVVPDDDLLPLLAHIHDTARSAPVLIDGDEGSELKRLTFVIDACNKTGLDNFSLQSRNNQ